LSGRFLEFVTGQGSLRRVASQVAKPKLTSRFYTPVQVEMVQRAQTDSNALATRIAHEAGLRAHELLTLRRADEDRLPGIGRGGPSASRAARGSVTSSRARAGSSGRYCCRGRRRHGWRNGGWRRRGRSSTGASATARSTTSRGGNRWAVSFSAASERALGWSRGAHGLRHSYAQERLRELQGLRDADGKPAGLYYRDAKAVISQELGHFREDIVNTYLR
jgi:integrase